MARKKAKIPSKKCINDGDVSGGSSDTANDGVSPPSPPPPPPPPLTTEKGLVESFYEKLARLHQSSGLSLVFNFQESKVDLYLLYKKVTENGGFHQVKKEGKWNEVVNASNLLKMQVPLLLPNQVQKLYEILLLQYEQVHYYRTPAKEFYTTTTTDTGNRFEWSLGKRKSSESSSHDHHHYQVAAEHKRSVQMHFDEKDIEDLQLPKKPRTAYQMFVKMECDRLRKLNEESFSSIICYRNMAIEAWKHLSDSERKPYIEASKKDKERFSRDMDAYEQIWNQNLAKKQKLLSNPSTSIINFGPAFLSPNDDNGYYVTLADTENSLPHKLLAETTDQILKGSGPNDPMLQINWDGCCDSSNP